MEQDPNIMGNPDLPQLENIPTVIFDIDGTLADIEHRRHFVEGKKKDFDSFNAAMVNDTPNAPIVDLMWMCLGRFDLTQVIFCTGRMEQYREVTRNFLLDDCEVEDFLSLVMDKHRHKPKYRRMVEDTLDVFLIMRPDERRHDPDHQIKQEMLDDILKTVDKSNILYAVDDRQRVVDMWRSNGLTCLQVAEGNF